jgi:hypothetical protein
VQFAVFVVFSSQPDHASPGWGLWLGLVAARLVNFRPNQPESGSGCIRRS